MVYKVKPLDGVGLVKVVNRVDLLEDIQDDNDTEESAIPDSDSSSEEEGEFVEHEVEQPEATPTQPEPTKPFEVGPRRSRRANKGQHSNVNKLPNLQLCAHKTYKTGVRSFHYTGKCRLCGYGTGVRQHIIGTDEIPTGLNCNFMCVK